MRKRFKICAICLSVVLTLSLCSYMPSSEVQGKEKNLEYNNRIMWKDKITEDLWEVLEKEKDEKVKVCIWYNDINQEEVTKKTENETGILYDSIVDNDIETMDEALLMELADSMYGNDKNNSNKKQQLKDKIQAYLQETEIERKEVMCLIDKYISKRRDISKKAYKKKHCEMKELLEISEEEIIFESLYTPMIIAELNKKQIKHIAKFENVEGIYLYIDAKVVANTTVEQMKEINGLTIDFNPTGLSGKGVKVGILDLGAVKPNSDLPAERFVYSIGSQVNNTHAMNVARILAGEDGVANDAIVYSVDANSFLEDTSFSTLGLGIPKFYGGVELLISKGVNIINASFSLGPMNNELRATDIYAISEKWVDHVVRMHNVTFVEAAGNNGNAPDYYIECPALAYNIITVGAMNDQGTASQLDDIMYKGSAYYNGTGCSKPDVVVTENVLGGCTSSAAPIVSGIVALMMELNPSLKSSPETVKAILLASCHKKVIDAVTLTQKEFMVSGLTEKQGAGVVDLFSVINIISKNQYGFGTSSYSISKNVTIPYEPLSYANVSITWLQNSAIPIGVNHLSESASIGTIQNMSLSLYNNSSLVKTSNLANSSTEMVYFPLKSNTIYQMKLSKVNSTSQSIRYAYAWSTMADYSCPKGDVNLDYKVDLLDVQLATKVNLGIVDINELQTYLCDFNSNGKIEQKDVQLIQNAALGF